MKRRLLLITIAALLATPLWSFTGCFESGSYNKYLDGSEDIKDELSSVIANWDEAIAEGATDYELAIASKEAYQTLNSLIDQWRLLEPPDDFEEFHEWTNIAFNYARQAFGLINEYYSSTSDDYDYLENLRNIAQELLILGDQALFKANNAYRRAIPD